MSFGSQQPFMTPNGQTMSYQEILTVAFRNMYLQLVPVCAAKVMEKQTRRDESWMGEVSQDELIDEIVDFADKLATAAFEKMGVTIK